MLSLKQAKNNKRKIIIDGRPRMMDIVRICFTPLLSFSQNCREGDS